jgi:hypothetical protein
MPRKNTIVNVEGNDDQPQVPKMASKRTLTPEQLSNLARARQKAQELRRKAKEDREDKAKMDAVEKEIEKKIKKTVNKKEVLVDDEPELQEEEYLKPSDVQPPTEPDPMPPSIEPPEISLAKTIKQKKKIIFEDSGSDDESNEHIIVVRKKTEKKLPEPVPVVESKPQPVFYREAPIRPINPFQRHNADIYRR